MKTNALSMVLIMVFSASLYSNSFSYIQENSYDTEGINMETGKEYIYYFPLPAEIKYDSENIYVLDASDSNIKIFSKSGEYRDIIARKGRGPGELDMPSGMDLFEDRIYIADKMNRRIQVLDKDGGYLGGFKTNFFPDRIVVLDEDRIVVSRLPLIEESEVTMTFCFSQQGELLWEEFDSYYSGDRVYDTFRNRINLGITKEKELIIAKKNNERNIYRYSREGTLLDKISITKEYLSKEVVLPVKQRKKIINLYSEFAISDNRLYLLASQYASNGKSKDLVPGKKIHVFDIKGNSLGEIELPDRFKLISIDGDRIYGINSDSELRILKVKEKR